MQSRKKKEKVTPELKPHYIKKEIWLKKNHIALSYPILDPFDGEVFITPKSQFK